MAVVARGDLERRRCLHDELEEPRERHDRAQRRELRQMLFAQLIRAARAIERCFDRGDELRPIAPRRHQAALHERVVDRQRAAHGIADREADRSGRECCTRRVRAARIARWLECLERSDVQGDQPQRAAGAHHRAIPRVVVRRRLLAVDKRAVARARVRDGKVGLARVHRRVLRADALVARNELASYDKLGVRRHRHDAQLGLALRPHEH